MQMESIGFRMGYKFKLKVSCRYSLKTKNKALHLICLVLTNIYSQKFDELFHYLATIIQMNNASDASVPRRRLIRKVNPSQTKFSHGLVRQRSFELDDDELQATQLQRVVIITIDGSERAFPTNEEFLVPDIQPQDEFPEHLLR